MRFILAFVFSLVSVFAIAQAPPMVLGGPQGIDVTRILARNWMSIPIYADTPTAPLTGAGWPGRGYLITVVKNEAPCQNCPPKDTSLWIYTGNRWKRVGMDYVTRLVYGGQVSKASGNNLNYIIQPYGAFFDGDYRSSLTNRTATLAPKTINNTARIDVLVLNRDSFLVKTGIPKAIPQKPIVTGSEIEVASFYFQAFDSIPTMINTSAKVTNIYRVAGIDSIYFNIDTLTFAIKDSVGITKNDTASMLNPYKFTAANGLTKDSTVFRLGGSLNQNTNINLNTRRLTFIGGNDTTRFFSNGRVSIGGTPDSTSNFRVNGTTRLNGNTTYNGNLIPSPTESGSLYVAGFTRSSSPNGPARLQVYTNGGVTPIQYFELGSNEINHRQDVQIFFNKTFGYDLHAFGVKGIHTSAPGAGNTYSYVKVFPTIRVGPVTGNDTTFIRGFDFRPTLDSFNNVRMIPFTNTVGSNMFNTTWGNTRIGYPLSTLTSGNTTAYDTTFKLDVNGNSRFTGAIYQRFGTDSTGFARSESVNILVGNQQPQSRRGILIGNGTFNNTNNISIGIGHLVNVGAGTGSVAIGYTSSASGGGLAIGSAGLTSSAINGGVAIGPNAQSTGGVAVGTSVTSSNGGLVFGNGSSANAGLSIALGSATSTNASQSVAIGHIATANNANSIALGLLSTTTASNQLVIGGNDASNTYGINDVYIGSGVRNAAKAAGKDVTYNGSGAGDSANLAGGNITIAGGKGTGIGTPGSVIFSTSSTLTNPSDSLTLQTLTERARINQNGRLLIGTTSDNGFLVNAAGGTTSNGLYARGYTPLKADYVNEGNTIFNAGLSSDSSSVSIRAGSIGEFYRILRIFGARAGEEVRVNGTSGTNTNQDTTAFFEITSTNAGFLQPRMTNVQRDSISSRPTTGLQLFSTTDSANYVYRGTGGGWQKIANEISGSATLDFPSTGHGTSSDIAFTVTGAELGDVVSIGIPNAAMSANISYTAWVSATDTVTVRLDHYASSGNVDPVSATFKVKVFK